MSTILYIKANIKPEGTSRTFRISDRFIESYKKSHPDDTIVTLDLYKEGIKFMSAEGIAADNLDVIGQDVDAIVNKAVIEAQNTAKIF
jgi:FMN-dependent NADH-azoreductase